MLNTESINRCIRHPPKKFDGDHWWSSTESNRSIPFTWKTDPGSLITDCFERKVLLFFQFKHSRAWKLQLTKFRNIHWILLNVLNVSLNIHSELFRVMKTGANVLHCKIYSFVYTKTFEGVMIKLSIVVNYCWWIGVFPKTEWSVRRYRIEQFA